MAQSPVFTMIRDERMRQSGVINLTASESYAGEEIMSAVGSVFTNKYAEGYPGRRYYAGCEVADRLETYCCEKWQQVFQTDYHVNVQPHSGTNANLAAYLAVLDPSASHRKRILSLGLNDGGHLSHGHPANLSGKLYNICHYGLDENGLLDYSALEDEIFKTMPDLILVGASAYSRTIDFERIDRIIRGCSTYLQADGHTDYKPVYMADIAHIAGLVAAGLHHSPFGYADIVTMTTHKTLCGPRGGLIFCRPELASKIDSAVFPGMQGGPMLHVIAGKALCAERVLTEGYREVMTNVVQNSKAMAEEFRRLGYRIVSGGTDNHLFLLDLTDTGLTGREVERRLYHAGIAVNKNCIPGETRPPAQASGIRIGTMPMTELGYTRADFVALARTIDKLIQTLKQEKEDSHGTSGTL